MKAAFFTSILLLQLTLSSFAHADQSTLNCGAFGNDTKSRSFILTADEEKATVTFNNTGGTGASGTINAQRSNKTVTVFSMNLFGHGDWIGIPKNLNKSEITVRYYIGSNFGAYYTATCTKI